ncbi:hypothetical protein ONS95_007214 [Cadophora gregata]|uniref:uncharacterized protein n=1 Tax=Cadophora gregata TaxID=51156 RepID=UPI0026DC6138|nr:uncharacterized protein ONS95_007214 [Cadophora gregata]KAK0100765.1 hypothetical protein ONS95_007214 [Cadophora gregata]KAK0117241.1 hypothetical protein ONS96_013074 [Cadophora gregata f. sp. sojae]
MEELNHFLDQAEGAVLDVELQPADTEISFHIGFALEADPPLPHLTPIAPVYQDAYGLYNTDAGPPLGPQSLPEYRLIHLRLTSTYAELLDKVSGFHTVQDRLWLQQPASARHVALSKIIVKWAIMGGFSNNYVNDDEELRELLKMIVKRGFVDSLVVIYKWNPIVS